MVKQTAAAQRRTDAEARKAAKAASGSTAAASSHVSPGESQADVAAEPQASKGTTRQGRAASECALPQAGDSSAPALAVSVEQAGKGPKAELQTTVDIHQMEQGGTTVGSSHAAQGTAGAASEAAQAGASSTGDVCKAEVTTGSIAPLKQRENQDMNSLRTAAATGEEDVKVTAGDLAGNGKARAGRKRAAGAIDDTAAGASKTGAQASRSTRSKQGTCPLCTRLS